MKIVSLSLSLNKFRNVFQNMLFVFISLAFTSNIFAQGWTYSGPSSGGVIGQISNGDWTFDVWVEYDALSFQLYNIAIHGKSSVLHFDEPISDGKKLVEIYERTFQHNSFITAVYLPDSLRTIGNAAFWDCTALTTVEPFFSDSVNYIGWSAFEGCINLTGDFVVANPNLTYLGDGSFSNTKIKSVDLSKSGITILPQNTFLQCEKLESVLLPKMLEQIGYDAFAYCTSLTNVAPFLPNTVYNISWGVFYKCPIRNPLILDPISSLQTEVACFTETQIPSIYFGTNVTYFSHNNTFQMCTNVTQVWFSGDVPGFGGSPFTNWNNHQAKVYAPKANGTWQAYIDINGAALLEEEEILFGEIFPNDKLPVGMLYLPSCYQFYYRWNIANDQTRTTLLIVN